MVHKEIMLSALMVASLAATNSFADEEQSLLHSIAEYTDAFNRGDVKAMVQGWTEDGVWIHPDGSRIEGLSAIKQELAGSSPGVANLEVADVQIRFVTPRVAVEEGVARLKLRGLPVGESSYEAMHVLTDNGWKITNLREFEPSSQDSNPHLEPLEWLVGNWVDEAGEGHVKNHVQWTRNHAFLVNNFSVNLPGEETLQGVQIIGWEPHERVIRSWLFDSDGGVGGGVWHRDGTAWVVQFDMTLADGRHASSTNIYQPVDQNSFRWFSVERIVGGQPLENIENVVVLREKKVETTSAVESPQSTASPVARAE